MTISYAFATSANTENDRAVIKETTNAIFFIIYLSNLALDHKPIDNGRRLEKLEAEYARIVTEEILAALKKVEHGWREAGMCAGEEINSISSNFQLGG
jgi:hypothetical protein